MRVDHKDLRLAWAEGAEGELLALLRKASTKTIRRAAEELQARDPEDAGAFRSWLADRGIYLAARGGAQPPAVGTVRCYSTQELSRQRYIRLPVELLGKRKGDPVWVSFDGRDGFRVLRYDPRSNGSSESESSVSDDAKPPSGSPLAVS